MRDQVLADYADLEADGEDAWNPILIDMQLGYRLALLYGLSRALRASGADLDTLDVVDLGCGNGRSTRAYLEFGLKPNQLCGLDFRAGAIAMARQMHPAIRYDVQMDGRLPFADGTVGWLSLCMVVSSIQDPADRRSLAAEVSRVLRPGGHLFYIDHPYTSDAVGLTPLDPGTIFTPLKLRWQKQLRLLDVLTDADLPAWDPTGGAPRPRWRFGQGGPLRWVPRPDGLGAAVKARLPVDLNRWLSREPAAFDIRLYAT